MSSPNDRLPKAVFLLLAAAASLYFSHYYPFLPRVVASHFDQHGIANGWQTKQTFFETLVAMTLLGGFLVFGIPGIIAAMPARLINLPNKSYWLGQEQRAASMQFLSAWFAWFGCAVYLVIIMAYDFAVQTNLHSPHGVNASRLWYGLAFFVTFTVIWTIRLLNRFSRLPRQPSA